MQATPSLDFIPPKPKELNGFANMLQKSWRNLTTLINNKIGFGDGTNHDNIDGVWANVVAPVAPNTDFVVTHNLGRVPVGYWVMQKDRACDVYTGSVAATSSQITLRATVASAVLRLFILSFILALFGVTSYAQTTNLTLQVTDAGGQTWNNGTWSAVLSTPPGVTPTGPPFNGIGTTTPVPNQNQSGTLSATGSATMTLTQNSGIVPALSQWKFVVCPQATAPCFSQFATITATATLTLVPPAISVNCGPGVTAYVNAEVSCGVGGSYYNLISTSIQTCQAATGSSCTLWGGSSSSSSPNWNRLGTVIGVPFVQNTTHQETSCFIQTTPKVLSANYTQVVACLRTNDVANADNIWYSEAPSPLGPFTDYSGNPVITGAACPSNILSISGQLVVFACKGRTDIERYHSADNGITWVDDGLIIAHGGGGWKNGYAENPFELIVGSTCHLWFEGSTTLSAPLLIGQGHATGNSTCAFGSFTEDAGDPVIPVSEFNGGGPFIFYDGSNFWEWEHGTPGGSSDAYPTNMYFTRLNANGSGSATHVHTKIFQARLPDEGSTQTGQNTQVADPFILEWPFAAGDARNTSYLFYTACSLNCANISQQMTIKVASLGGPLSTLIAGGQTQGDATVLPFGYAWQNAIDGTRQIPGVGAQFDDGQRANGQIGSNWIALNGSGGIQIVSNQFEASNIGGAGRQGYVGASFSKNQYSSVVFVAAAATSQIGVSVRAQPNTTSNLYECVTSGTVALGSSQTMVLRKVVAGTPTNITTFTATPAAGDVWELDAVGTLLTCKQNGTVRTVGQDSTFPTGVPGMTVFDSAAVANAIIKNWIGGSL